MLKKTIKFSLYVLSFFILYAEWATACPVCFADPKSQTSQAVSYAIVALLGVTGSVLGGFVALFLYLRKRAMKITLNRTVSFPSVN